MICVGCVARAHVVLIFVSGCVRFHVSWNGYQSISTGISLVTMGTLPCVLMNMLLSVPRKDECGCSVTVTMELLLI